jgi:hypothetical protein
MTYRQVDQMSASDKKHAEAQGTHFRWANHLPLGSDKQPIERSELADFVIILEGRPFGSTEYSTKIGGENSCNKLLLDFSILQTQFLSWSRNYKLLACSRAEHGYKYLLYKIMP